MLNEGGEVIEEGTFRNTESSIQKCFGRWGRTRIALETGTQSGWISRLLSGYGHEVIVAHARELRGISHSDRKNDRNDAEKLAHYARLDPELLHPVQHRDEQQQVELSVVHARDALVRARTLSVNAARGLAKVQGKRLPPTVTKTFGQRAGEKIQFVLLSALRPLLAQIDQLTEQIEHYDSLVERIAEARYPETVPLRSIPSIGPITALTFILTLGDRERFTRSRANTISNLVSRKPATAMCVSCWCDVCITLWDTSAAIRGCGNGDLL